ncbi:MAG: MFS transporter [Pseudomonadota bacterium]|nr:MFS transporter [Pseudomonadota bacterium]
MSDTAAHPQGSAFLAALLVVPLASFATPFLASSINVALPAIAAEYRLDAITLGWFNTAYFLSASVLMLPLSRLADILGRRRFFLIGVALLALSCFALPLADSGPGLIGLRLIQGVAGAFIFATSHAIMVSVAPPEKRGRAIGINITAVYVGMTCGPVIGGILTYQVGWRSLFYLSGVISATALLLCARHVRGEWAEARGERFDILGSLLLIGGLGALILASGGAGISRVLVGLLLLAAFFLHQRRTPSPLLDLDLLTRNPGVAAATGSALALYCGTFGVGFLLSLYLQYARGLNPQQAGLVLLAQPVAQVFLAALAGRLSDSWQPRTLTTLGGGLCAAGVAVLAVTVGAAGTASVTLGLVLLGAGIACFSPPNATAALSAVAPRQVGVTGGLLQTMRLIGQMSSMGIVLLVFVMVLGSGADLAQTDPATLHTTLALAYWPFFALCAVAALVSRIRPTRKPLA